MIEKIKIPVKNKSFLRLPYSVSVTAALICGIICQRSIPVWVNGSALIMEVCLLVTATFYLYRSKKHPSLLWIPVALSCFLIGAWRYEIQIHRAETIRSMLSNTTQDIIGTIDAIIPTGSPGQLLYQIHITEHKDSNTEQWLSQHFLLHLYSSKNRNTRVADVITMEKISIPQLQKSDFYNYLTRQGIACSVFSDMHNQILIHRPTQSLNRWLHETSTNLTQKITSKMSKKTASLFAALFMGNTKLHHKEHDLWSYLFRTWGISHYLARSGLHLTIFVYIWFLLLRCIPCHQALKQIILLLLTMIYSLLSWPSVSFYRALYSFIIGSWLILEKRTTDLLNILSVVCTITLLQNPSHLFFLDFQLSYSLTFALAWINHLNKKDIKPQ